MSKRLSDNLTGEKIQQLLSAVGSTPVDENSKTEAKEHNWGEPHYFSNEQIKNLTAFAENSAAAIAGKFVDLCQSQFEVTIDSITQHFAGDFLNQSSNGENKAFYLPFGTEQGLHFGLVGMPEQTAVTWTKQLLGDSESEESSERELSQLEKSLLLDLASALINAFSEPSSNLGFHPAHNIVYQQWPLEMQDTQELCRISFNVKKTDTDNSTAAYFLIPCSKLEPVAGNAIKAGCEFSQEDISKMILKHLDETPVCVTVKLASAELSFEEMMDLQVDDILLLDKKVNEPVELIVDGHTICYGWPAKSDGKYAVTISATAYGDTA